MDPDDSSEGAPAYQKLEGNDSTVSASAPPLETPPRCSRRLRLGVVGVVIVLVIVASTITVVVSRHSRQHDASSLERASFSPPTRVRRSWKTFSEDDKLNASCNSLESCSQFLRDMGGGGKTTRPAGEFMQSWTRLARDRHVRSPRASQDTPCNHVNGTASGKCRNCVMRGNWSNPHKIVQTLGPDLLRVLRVFKRDR
ncbi:hypothetical protein PINS_up020397 [Pythium insidiosum]|nr:hypothetical protein PINS_up020397 [Pythium insidiosum]